MRYIIIVYIFFTEFRAGVPLRTCANKGKDFCYIVYMRGASPSWYQSSLSLPTARISCQIICNLKLAIEAVGLHVSYSQPIAVVWDDVTQICQC